MGHAATFARTAKVARAATVQRLGQICDTRGHDHAAELFTHALAEERLLAGERNRRLESTVGKKIDALRASRNTDVYFAYVVVRFDHCISYRTCYSLSVI